MKVDKKVTGTCSFSWATDKEDLLVNLWREKPCLYAISSRQYDDSSQVNAVRQQNRVYLVVLALQNQGDCSVRAIVLFLMLERSSCYILSSNL